MVEITEHAGYIGAFTRHQADGAILNGRRILKRNSEAGDTHKNGTPGTVLGSIDVKVVMAGQAIPDEYADIAYFYFVEWDDFRGFAAGVIDRKIEAAP